MNPRVDQLLAAAFAHADAGRPTQAAQALEQVIALAPDHAEALHELGLLKFQLGDHQQAVSLMIRAAAAAPSELRYHINLGVLLRRLQRAAEAIPHLERAVEISPDPTALTALGGAFYSTGRLTEAAETYARLLSQRPGDAAAMNLLGDTLKDQGKLSEAIAAYRRAMQLQPRFAAAHSNLLLCMNYDDQLSPRELFDEHRAFAQQYESQRDFAAKPPAARPPAADGRLRIGYLSPDLRQHSVAFFMWPVLNNHDRSRFCVTCYSDVSTPDTLTQMLQRLPERWHSTAAMSDEQLAAQIEQDQIDVLIELAGHTGRNRLPLLASRRLAPVQVTWLGYPNTTGLSSIDYRLTDAIADPPGESDALHSEKLLRLPNSFFCYVTPGGVPDVAPPPAIASGRVTFAVFANFPKIRPHTMQLWTDVLHAVPGSRLIVQSKSFADAPTREQVQAFFSERGLGGERVELRPWLDFPQYICGFGEIDIIVDTQPFAGHTTTCHALWMGVPVVTLRGRTHRGRMGASVLTHAGLTELMAADHTDYVRICRELATDLPRLAKLRASIRERMRQSPMMNGPQFTRDLEAAYTAIARTPGR